MRFSIAGATICSREAVFSLTWTIRPGWQAGRMLLSANGPNWTVFQPCPSRDHQTSSRRAVAGLEFQEKPPAAIASSPTARSSDAGDFENPGTRASREWFSQGSRNLTIQHPSAASSSVASSRSVAGWGPCHQTQESLWDHSLGLFLSAFLCDLLYRRSGRLKRLSLFGIVNQGQPEFLPSSSFVWISIGGVVVSKGFSISFRSSKLIRNPYLPHSGWAPSSGRVAHPRQAVPGTLAQLARADQYLEAWTSESHHCNKG